MPGDVAPPTALPLPHRVESETSGFRRLRLYGPRYSSGRTPGTARPIPKLRSPTGLSSGNYPVAHPDTQFVSDDGERLISSVVPVTPDRARQPRATRLFAPALHVVIRLPDPAESAAHRASGPSVSAALVSNQIVDPCRPGVRAALVVIALDRQTHPGFPSLVHSIVVKGTLERNKRPNRNAVCRDDQVEDGCCLIPIDPPARSRAVTGQRQSGCAFLRIPQHWYRVTGQAGFRDSVVPCRGLVSQRRAPLRPGPSRLRRPEPAGAVSAIR